jgi:hypothetical protein
LIILPFAPHLQSPSALRRLFVRKTTIIQTLKLAKAACGVKAALRGKADRVKTGYDAPQ